MKEGMRQAKATKPLDYENQGVIVLAVDSSYIGIGFYIYQEDLMEPKKVYYAKFGSRPMNDHEAQFSQPKRGVFGLKEVLRMNKKWLFSARKLVVKTDAKYIKKMIENLDMMPTATINRWIDEILMYQFILRHKAGATFGPDGLSRRPVQKDDLVFEPCSDDEEEPSGLPLFEVADLMEPRPLPIEKFVDEIDSWKEFFNGIAESIKDFEEELARADSERAKEKIGLQNTLAEVEGLMPSGQAKYV